MLFGGLINESRARIAADAARMLVAQGADRDRIVQALMQRAQQRNLPPAQREAILSAANRIMQGAEKPAVDAVTSSDPPPLVHRSKYRDNPDSGYASGISSILEDDARKRKP
jgi:acyl-CoA reductase-like NAD-dependent aldehyde dehydrogenase